MMCNFHFRRFRCAVRLRECRAVEERGGEVVDINRGRGRVPRGGLLLRTPRMSAALFVNCVHNFDLSMLQRADKYYKIGTNYEQPITLLSYYYI